MPKALKCFLCTSQNAVCGIPVDTQCAKAHTGQERHAFAGRLHHMDVKFPIRYRFDHPLIEHQMPLVSAGHQHPLLTIQAQAFTTSKVAFNLFVDAADRQQLAMLIDRPSHRNALPQGQA